MDARRCISYLTIELRGPIPRDLRPAIGNRIFGCDICQEVCPWNERFPEHASLEGRYAARGPGELPAGVEALPGETPTAAAGPVDMEVAPGSGGGGAHVGHPGTAAPPLIALLETALDPDAWDTFSRGSPTRRPGRAGFARNVCVALGNWGDPQAVEVLAAALRDSEPVVRGHAAWALGRIDAPQARAALSGRLSVESDEAVLEELRAASSP